MTVAKPGLVAVFDLDDTLYLERDYVRSGMAAAGAWFQRETGVPGLAATGWRLFENGRRGTIFNEALKALGVAETPELIRALVDCYREHAPAIALAPDAAALLASPPPGWAMALVTDGPVASQSRKIAALRLHELGLAPIVMTAALGPGMAKPHPQAFEQIARHHGAPPHRCLYVADNAAKDFAGPRQLGWRTVQIRRPGGLYPAAAVDADHAADATLASLAGLAALLDDAVADA